MKERIAFLGTDTSTPREKNKAVRKPFVSDFLTALESARF